MKFLEWLLDLDGIALGRDAPVFLRFQSQLPGWLLFGGALIAALLIVLIYRRERARPGLRVVLGVVRGLLVLLVGVVLCRPSLVLQRNRSEPSHVVLLIDQSRSMASVDRYRDEVLAGHVAAGAGLDAGGAVETHSRLDLVQRALTRGDGGWLDGLLSRNGLRICTFAQSVAQRGFVDKAGSSVEALGSIEGIEAEGTGTDLAGALQSVLRRSGGRRLAAVILATDGQTQGGGVPADAATDGADSPSDRVSAAGGGLDDVVDEARGRIVPVYPLRIGSTVRPLDIELGRVRAEPRVFVGDLVAVEADVSSSGLTGPTAVTVRLIEVKTGPGDAKDVTLAEREVELSPESPDRMVELTTKMRRVGRFDLRVEVEPLADEMTAANNSGPLVVQVQDAKLNVLYVEGYPRYEYRFLKNALLRESTVRPSVLLLEADSRFVQEGVEPLRAFPDTPEALRKFDVVIFGDVDPRGGWLSDAQMRMLLDYVGNEGGGFALVAGERYAPHRFLGTPLEKLLPVKIDPTYHGGAARAAESGFRLALTHAGRASRLFTFAGSGEDRAAMFDALPELYWFAPTLGPRPGAIVLARHPSTDAPLVVEGRYGAGRTLFQATDDSWRWRRHTGELLHDTYWLQVARELMRDPGGAGDRRFTFRTDRREYDYGRPVRAQVEFFDPRLMALHAERVTVDVLAGGAEVDVVAGVADERFDLERIGDETSIYEGSFVPRQTGRLVLRAAGLSQGEARRPATVDIRVTEPDLEGLRPEADHRVLSRIAEATGGRVVELDELADLVAEIPDRSVLIPDDVVEPLWDSRLPLILFALLVGIEWTLRKMGGLM